jgi:hypothetical protein
MWGAAACLVMLSAASVQAAPTVGVMTDIGVPDAGTISLVARPVRPLRLELGASDDVVGPGIRGGVTWIMLHSWATPVLGAGYGDFFERNATQVARFVTGDPTFSSPLLDRVGYQFAFARTGIELGRGPVTFFIHAGIAHVTGSVSNLTEALAMTGASSGTGSGSANVTVTSADAHVAIWCASADVGLVVYIR